MYSSLSHICSRTFCRIHTCLISSDRENLVKNRGPTAFGYIRVFAQRQYHSLYSAATDSPGIRFSAPCSSGSGHGTVGRCSTLLQFIHVSEPHLGHVTVLFRILTFSRGEQRRRTLCSSNMSYFLPPYSTPPSHPETQSLLPILLSGVLVLLGSASYSNEVGIVIHLWWLPRTSQSYINCSNDTRKIESTGGRK
jgi:hypothetical protein